MAGILSLHRNWDGKILRRHFSTRRFIIFAIAGIVSLWFLLNASARIETPTWFLPPVVPQAHSVVSFQHGEPKPAGQNYTRVLVVGHLKSEDVSWIQSELPDLQTALYVMDDNAESESLHPPMNKGHEAMAYLTYIIDHYDDLPDTVLFFHPHRYTWHNNVLLATDSVETIRRLSDARVAREGYVNSRCHLDPGCPDWLHLDRPSRDYDFERKGEEQHIKPNVWMELHPGEPVPAVLSNPCCAQFAVSRAFIRARPRESYIHYRAWLMNTKLSDNVSGRLFEYSWQFIFGGVSEFCPSMHTCYCDTYGICFESAADLDDWLNDLKQREFINEELNEWIKQNDEKVKPAGFMLDHDTVLRAKLELLDQQLEERKDAAYSRGDDPKKRADSAGRTWQIGDGF
jgi:hypothetical protein